MTTRGRTSPSTTPCGHFMMPGFIVNAALSAMAEERVDVAALTSALGLHVGGDTTGFQRLQFTDFARMLRVASNAGRNPLLGVRIAERFTESSLHMLGPLVVASPTLGEAISATADLQGALFGGKIWDLTVVGDAAHFGPVPVLERDSSLRVALDLGLTLVFRMAQRFVGAAHHAEVAMHLTAVPPELAAAYRQAFGANVCFSAARSGIYFPRHVLDRTRPGTDATFAATLKQIATERFSAASNDTTWSQRLERELQGHSELAQVDFDAIATRFRISVRTLRRKVELEGTRLSEILNRVRFERARQELTLHRAPIRAIAESLGYADVSSFHRAFKRWAGVGPGEYRARVSGNPLWQRA